MLHAMDGANIFYLFFFFFFFFNPATFCARCKNYEADDEASLSTEAFFFLLMGEI